MTLPLIKELIPKIGRQIRFLNKYKQYMKIVLSNEKAYNDYIAKNLSEVSETSSEPTATQSATNTSNEPAEGLKILYKIQLLNIK